MTLNLLPLPYLTARNIIFWCWEHDVEREKCLRLVEAMTKTGNRTNDADWVLEIPDKYLSWFVLKWGFQASEYDEDSR